MNGNEALTFVRERHSFGDGDLQRNRNQVKVLKALSSKVLSTSMITNTDSILSAVGESFKTDMNIGSLVKLQTQLMGQKVSFQKTGWQNRILQCNRTECITEINMERSVQISNAPG